MSSRKYQMKKEEPKYVNMKGKTVGNNNAVGGGETSLYQHAN